MAKKPAGGVTGLDRADRDGVDRAIDALTCADLLKLKKFAIWRMQGLGRARLYRDADLLLQEAITATLVGCEGGREGRRWNKRVDFVKHLLEAMRSISNHWKEQYDDNEALSESECVIVNADGKERSLLDALPAIEPSAERVLTAKDEVKRIAGLFEKDEEATLVLRGWLEGMIGPEIMARGLTKLQYQAAVRRIRYGVRPNTI